MSLSERINGSVTAGQEIIRIKPIAEVPTQKDTIIRPHSIQPVSVSVFDALYQTSLDGHGASIRSRYAQLGLDCLDHVALRVVEASKNGETGTTVLVINHSDRPVQLPGGEELFKLYGYKRGEFINGSSLTDLVTNGKIGIIGEQGKDWNYWRNQDGEICGIELKINHDSWTWIPPHPNNEAVSIHTDGHSREFRQTLNRILRPVSDDTPLNQTKLWIGETHAHLHVDSAFIGYLDPTIPNSGNLSQLNSPLLYGGNTDQWPIRVENIVMNNKPPETIVVVFTHAG